MSGLTTAWLLQDDHDVMLFERQARLGGHAQTIDVGYDGQTVSIDVAAEFFGDARSYPLFHRLLGQLSVPTRSFAMTATVYNNESGRKLVLPPWRRGTIDWSMLSVAGVRDLLRFAKFSTTVANSDEATLRSETIGAFLARIPSEDFCREMLLPFLIGQFGMPRAAFDDCLAYDILKYCSLAGAIRLSVPAMSEVVGGTRAYIESLAKALGPRRISTGVSIERIEVENRKTLCHFADGQSYSADHVVLATGVADIGRLCPAGATGDTIRNVVSTVDTFEAEIAIHGDASIMPRDRTSWSVANFRATAQGGALTVWKSWQSSTPLFRSWVTGEPRVLRNEVGRFKFRHPIGDAKYYAAQKALQALQGRDNIWFAGSYVPDNDCQESAVASSISIAEALAPGGRRLASIRQ
jgi:predicted NAD/FAD-binding protein